MWHSLHAIVTWESILQLYHLTVTYSTAATAAAMQEREYAVCVCKIRCRIQFSFCKQHSPGYQLMEAQAQWALMRMF